MIGTLFRLDPSIRGTWALLMVGFLGGSLLRTVSAQLPADFSSLGGEERAWITFSLGVGWLSCLLIVLFQNCGTRTSRFYLSLPLPARTIWWVRMVSLLYAGLLPILLATIMVSVRFSGEGLGVYVEPYFLLLGAKACTGIVLAAFLFQSPQPELQRIPPGVSYVLYVVFISFLVMLFVVLAPVGLAGVLIALTVSVALAVYLHCSIPKSFLVASLEEDDAAGVSGARATLRPAEGSSSPGGGNLREVDSARPEDSRPGERWIVHWTTFRVLLGHWQIWVFTPLILMYSALLWDAYETTRDPLPILLFVTVWPFVLAYQGIIRLYRLDHLPISRRVLFPYVFFSATLPVFLGIGIGALTVFPLNRSDCLVCYGGQGIEVPPEFWEIAWNGRAPRITAPWGESFEPTTCRIYPGSKLAVYLPYETREGLSARFMALQAVRAVGAIHGRGPYSEQQIADDPDNPLVGLMERRHEYRRGFPIEASIDAGSDLRARTWLLGAVGVIWICGLMALVWLLQFRFTQYRTFFSWLFLTAMAVWAGLLMFHFLGPLFGVLHPVSPMRFPLVLLRHLAEAVAPGIGALWAFIAISLALVYLILNVVFQGMEAPLGKVRAVWREYG